MDGKFRNTPLPRTGGTTPQVSSAGFCVLALGERALDASFLKRHAPHPEELGHHLHFLGFT